jgi:Mrp family chromosome partitioning ATPase
MNASLSSSTPARDRDRAVSLLPSRQAIRTGRPAIVGGESPLVEQILAVLGDPLADLARRIRRVGPVRGGTTVLLTGSRRGVGCTTMALALATAAAADRSVLLVDGDLDRPDLSGVMGALGRLGWADHVRGACRMEEALQPLAAPEGPVGMPLGNRVAEPAELWSCPALPEWLAACRQQYSLIVLDGGVIQQTASSWAPWADVALVVCKSGQRLAEDWATTWDRLEDGGTHVLGILETMV